MKKRKILRKISIILCFFLISASVSACNGRGDFYSGAKKYLKNKYGVKCDSLIYYEYPTDMSMGSSFGVVELKNGDRVVVSLADGNYADSYELLELYDAWTDVLSDELGADVVFVTVESEGTITFGNTAVENRTLGSFMERSQKRYNASNVDEFLYDFNDFTYNERIEVYIVEENATYEWMEDLADKLDAYGKKAGAKKIEASVFKSFNELRVQVDPDDYFYTVYGYKRRHANGNGREYELMYDWDYNRSHHYNTKKFRDKTIWITLVDYD